MHTKKAKELARTESMDKLYKWTPAQEAAIDEGLVDGDRIGLGMSRFADVVGDTVILSVKDKEIKRIKIADLDDAQRVRLLASKGVQA